MSFESFELGDVITLKRGYDLPNHQRVRGEVPIISSSGLNDFHNIFKKDGEGVITGRYGTLGQVFYVNGPYWPLNTTLYVQDFKNNNPRFIYYLLKTLNLAQYNGAAAVPGLDRKVLHKIRCIIPSDKSIQKKIANILSAYDDLIENNLKRIKLLEEAAQNIYREWFVHFRFPGWENAKWWVDEKGRRLPERWKISTFYEEVEIMSGGTPKTTEPAFWNGEIGFFTPTDASGSISLYVLDTEKTITEEGLSKCNSKLYDKDTVFITARGTVGKVRLAGKPMAMNQSCYALKMKSGQFNYFLAESAINAISEVKKRAVGGVFDTIVVDTFKQVYFVLPEIFVIDEFEKLAKNIFDQILNSNLQIANLKEARDLLLPRLMDGKIKI